MGLNILSLFDGISIAKLALDKLGISIDNYYASEINKDAIKISKTNHPNIIQLGDIKNWKNWNLPSLDLILAGSPCQGFSRGGKQLGFDDDRSRLFYYFLDILNYYSPPFFLLENVPMKKEYEELISWYLGLNPYIFDSALVSAQTRKRLYWANWEIKQPIDKKIFLSDIVKYKAPLIFVRPRGKNKGGFKITKKSPTVTASGWQDNIYYFTDKKIKFTIQETEQLQTIPIDYTKGISKTKRFNLIGNAWTLDIILHIFNSWKTKIKPLPRCLRITFQK